MARQENFASLKSERYINDQDLDRMESHVRECLVRGGLSDRIINRDAVTYMAHFLRESLMAPSDSNMVLIHRVTAWCMEAMNG